MESNCEKGRGTEVGAFRQCTVVRQVERKTRRIGDDSGGGDTHSDLFSRRSGRWAKAEARGGGGIINRKEKPNVKKSTSGLCNLKT